MQPSMPHIIRNTRDHATCSCQGFGGGHAHRVSRTTLYVERRPTFSCHNLLHQSPAGGAGHWGFISEAAPGVARDNNIAGRHDADFALVAHSGEAECQVRPRAQQPQPCLHPFQRLLSWSVTYDHTSTNVKTRIVTVLKPQAPSSRRRSRTRASTPIGSVIM